jgi:hypothetical protein
VLVYHYEAARVAELRYEGHGVDALECMDDHGENLEDRAFARGLAIGAVLDDKGLLLLQFLYLGVDDPGYAALETKVTGTLSLSFRLRRSTSMIIAVSYAGPKRLAPCAAPMTIGPGFSGDFVERELRPGADQEIVGGAVLPSASSTPFFARGLGYQASIRFAPRGLPRCRSTIASMALRSYGE